jgi:hypothetical protein
VIVLSIVLPVLVLIGVGLVFIRGTDPAAARDRDNADNAMLTNSDLGGAFTELEHATFARSRGGVRIADNVAGCNSVNAQLEGDGQAFVESTLKAQTGAAFQILFQQIFVMGSPATATSLASVTTGAVQSCLIALFEKGGSAGGLTVSVQPDDPPQLGSYATAFHGSMAVQGGVVAGDFDILLIQQGRAMVLVLAVDSTGSLHGTRLETLINTVLIRLSAPFGT